MAGLGLTGFWGPKPVTAKGIQPELPLSMGAPPSSTLLQSACLYLSHQVQVIHMASLLVCLSAHQLVLVTMTTGCKAPGHQWAMVLVGAVPWAGRGLVSSSRGKLGKGWSLRGLSGPSSLSALAFPSCHLCWELREGLSAIPGGRGPGADGWEEQPFPSGLCPPPKF